MSKKEIELGDEVKCKITGFQGIVAGLTKHLTGCDRANVTAPMNKDGKIGECYTFDLHALDIIKKGKVKIEEQPPEKRGGPPSKPFARK